VNRLAVAATFIEKKEAVIPALYDERGQGQMAELLVFKLILGEAAGRKPFHSGAVDSGTNWLGRGHGG